ncbi:T9SS type A sorting domain-containing protein [Lacinutrix himadriensis]|uniref:T9SS type A sorting domain-containing protein n=1 Tax=Lacinutrix himadriensis TaxID=641549 RepID=UPI0006E14D45|nr:T9SS type A sorting domain-containing protein [Lacinutrix himadriensis]
MYPNPVKNNITISLQDNATYSLLDINGRLVKQGELMRGETVLKLSALSSGLYIMKLKTDNQITIKKIIKE